jgi:hypothetical protein
MRLALALVLVATAAFARPARAFTFRFSSGHARFGRGGEEAADDREVRAVARKDL